MKIFKKLFVSIMSFVLLVGISPINAFAFETNIHDQDVILTSSEKKNINQLNSIGIDTELVTKLLTVSNHIYFNDDQTSLKIDLSDDILIKEYEFTEQQLSDFKAILDGTYQSSAINYNLSENAPMTRAAKRFYLSNSDLQAGTFAVLATAAQAGPAALMAAWTSISTALAGPLGTIAGLGTAILGGAFFADLALKITGALVQGKGVAFYLDWGIPPVTVAIE